MSDHKRIWAGVTAALLAGVSLNSVALADDATTQSAKPGKAWVFAQSGEGEGEGEGEAGGEGGGEGEGEGEGGTAVDPATNDAAYLTLLSLVRGHLLAGVTLYEDGHADQALTHMRHPGDELYGQIGPALEARGADGFGDELLALGEAVETQADLAQVQAAYEQALAKITAAEQAVGGGVDDPAVAAAVAVGLAQTAAEEYDIAVEDDGSVVNAHEYQDAWGFLNVARGLIDAHAEAIDADVLAEMRAALDTMQAAFGGPVPGETVETDPSVLYGAAAELEIAALGLE